MFISHISGGPCSSLEVAVTGGQFIRGPIKIACAVFGIVQIRPRWCSCSCITMTGEGKNELLVLISHFQLLHGAEMFKFAWNLSQSRRSMSLIWSAREMSLIQIYKMMWCFVDGKTCYSFGGEFVVQLRAHVSKFRWTGHQYTNLLPLITHFWEQVRAQSFYGWFLPSRGVHDFLSSFCIMLNNFFTLFWKHQFDFFGSHLFMKLRIKMQLVGGQNGYEIVIYLCSIFIRLCFDFFFRSVCVLVCFNFFVDFCSVCVLIRSISRLSCLCPSRLYFQPFGVLFDWKGRRTRQLWGETQHRTREKPGAEIETQNQRARRNRKTVRYLSTSRWKHRAICTLMRTPICCSEEWKQHVRTM